MLSGCAYLSLMKPWNVLNELRHRPVVVEHLFALSRPCRGWMLCLVCGLYLSCVVFLVLEEATIRGPR
jgi:hypothetical protein